MHVIMLSNYGSVRGGAMRITLESAAGLARRGHRVTLLCGMGPIDPRLLDVAGLRVVCLNQFDRISDPSRLRAAARGWWNWSAAKALYEIADQAKCLAEETIVHVHTWMHTLTASAIHAALKLRLPTVLTLHDFFTVCPNGAFFLHPENKICSLAPLSAKCVLTNCDSRNYGHKLWRVGRSVIQRRIGKVPAGIRHFIYYSDLARRILEPLLPRRSVLHRVDNFVSDYDFSERTCVEENRRFIFVGRLVREKGPQLAAQAALRLGVDITFVGDGPMRQTVQQIYPRATITGWVAANEVRGHLQQARALIFPSMWYETQGLVAIEALAAGIPVIAAHTCAAAEWIEDRASGLLFRSGDVDDLVTKIRELGDDAVLAQMSMQAFRRFRERPLTFEAHLNGLEQVYRKVIADCVASGP